MGGAVGRVEQGGCGRRGLLWGWGDAIGMVAGWGFGGNGLGVRKRGHWGSC